MPRLRDSIFRLVLTFVTGLVVLSILEGAARVAGYEPWSTTKADIVVEPGQTFYRSYPSLGYTHLPGHFKVTLSGSLVFRATHLDNTLRITEPATDQNAKQEIWIFGDSITYGWSVNDEESYPWLLHERLPAYRFVNFGVGGYGTVHSLIQLREALINERPPQFAIIAYAAWHNPRNTFIRLRRKMLVSSSHLGPLYHPYVRLTEDGKIDFLNDGLNYREFPLMRYSAFMHALEQTYNAYEERNAHSDQLTKLLMKEIIDLCKAKRIEVIIAGLTSDPVTTDLLSYCEEQGAQIVDISVDLTLKENNNLPFDSHPSAAAHRQYADKLVTFINQRLEASLRFVR